MSGYGGAPAPGSYLVRAYPGARDDRFGSQPEVSDGHANVGFWGQSGLQFRAAGGLLLAISGLSGHVPMSIPGLF